jgi:hypothetical protein
MESLEGTPRSRRAVLAAAAGAAGAIAATAIRPAMVGAADPNDVVMGVDNATTATTSVTDSGADSTAFAGHATGTGSGYGVEATSVGGAGLFAWGVNAPEWDPPFEPSFTSNTGVFGYAAAGDGDTTFGSGVWGDSPDTGVYGSGTYGVEGYGGVGVAGYSNGLSGGIGVYAWSPNNTATALRVDGKVHLSRSGRKSVASGHSSVAISLSGVTSTSKVFAVFATSESGRYVRAVVPTTGKFTVYFNTTLTSSATVAWFVLD